MHSSLDRPPSTPSRLDSFIENRSRYETAQLDLMVYLKWIILVIGVAIVVLLLKAMFAPPCSAGSAAAEETCRAESLLARTKRYVEEMFVGTAKVQKASETERPKDVLLEEDVGDLAQPDKGGFWSNLLPKLGFGCDSWRQLHERLSSQSFSVRPTLPPLPSVEEIKAFPAKFGVDLAQARRMPAAEARAAAPPEQLLARLAEAAGVPADDPRLAADGVAQRRPPLSDAVERVQAAEKSLAEGPQSDLRLRLNDLSGSFRSLAAKRAQVASLHARVASALDELTRCDAGLGDLRDHAVSESQRLQERREALKAGSARISSLRSRIEEKERSLSDAERRLRTKAVDLATRRSAAAAAAASRPATEAAIAAKLAEADAADQEATRLEAAYAKDLQGKQQLEAELKDMLAKKDSLQSKLDDINKLIEISEEGLRRRLSREELRRTIESITDNNHRDSIEKKLNERLADETAVVNEIFAEDPAESARLAEFISKDEAQIKNVLKIYDEFTESLRNFKGGEISIEEIRKTISDNKAQQSSLSSQLAQATSAASDLKNRVDRLNSSLGVAGSADRNRRDESRRLRAWAAEKRSELEKLEREAEIIEKEVKDAEAEALAEREGIRSRFEGLDEELAREIEDNRKLAAEVGELEKTVKTVADREALKASECAALKGFYLKAAEMVPVLRNHIEEDREKLDELKKGVFKTIDDFVNL
mgnify:CR=1 FL=1